MVTGMSSFWKTWWEGPEGTAWAALSWMSLINKYKLSSKII